VTELLSLALYFFTKHCTELPQIFVNLHLLKISFRSIDVKRGTKHATVPEIKSRFYPDRIAGGDCHHRNPDRIAASCRSAGP
jgi:hypothetical protein